MLRWTLVSLASVLCILLGLSVLGNWRTQSQLADEMGKLSAELKAIAAAKQTPPLSPQPPEVTGIIYAGSKDSPVPKAEVTIMRTDGSIVRRTTCDERGQYHSGPLDAGDYCVTTKTQMSPRNSQGQDWIAQSQPFFLYSGSSDVALDLDAKFHRAGLKISVSRTLPQIRKEGRYLIASRLHIYLLVSRMRRTVWTASEESPIGWPVYASSASVLPGPQTHDNLSAVFNLKGDDVGDIIRAFPAGPTRLRGTVSLNVFPVDENGMLLTMAIPGMILGEGKDPLQLTPESNLDANEGSFWWHYRAGSAWLTKLTGKPAVVKLVSPFAVDDSTLENMDLQEGVTRLRAEIPEGIEQEVEQAIEETTNAEEFRALVEKGLLTRPVKLTVIGHEPTK